MRPSVKHKTYGTAAGHILRSTAVQTILIITGESRASAESTLKCCRKLVDKVKKKTSLLCFCGEYLPLAAATALGDGALRLFPSRMTGPYMAFQLCQLKRTAACRKENNA